MKNSLVVKLVVRIVFHICSLEEILVNVDHSPLLLHFLDDSAAEAVSVENKIVIESDRINRERHSKLVIFAFPMKTSDLFIQLRSVFKVVVRGKGRWREGKAAKRKLQR